MIKRKDIQFRRYEGKECVGFEVEVETEEGITHTFTFRKLAETTWRISYIDAIGIQVPGFSPFNPWALEYDMPTFNYTLELVAATGLMHYNSCITELIQKKQILQYALIDMLKEGK